MAKKRNQLTVAAVKRMIGDNTPTPTGVDEAAVLAIIQAHPTHVVLGPQDPVPANIPTGTLIGRTT